MNFLSGSSSGSDINLPHTNIRSIQNSLQVQINDWDKKIDEENTIETSILCVNVKEKILDYPDESHLSATQNKWRRILITSELLFDICSLQMHNVNYKFNKILTEILFEDKFRSISNNILSKRRNEKFREKYFAQKAYSKIIRQSEVPINEIRPQDVTVRSEETKTAQTIEEIKDNNQISVEPGNKNQEHFISELESSDKQPQAISEKEFAAFQEPPTEIVHQEDLLVDLFGNLTDIRADCTSEMPNVPNILSLNTLQENVTTPNNASDVLFKKSDIQTQVQDEINHILQILEENAENVSEIYQRESLLKISDQEKEKQKTNKEKTGEIVDITEHTERRPVIEEEIAEVGFVKKGEILPAGDITKEGKKATGEEPLQGERTSERDGVPEGEIATEEDLTNKVKDAPYKVVTEKEKLSETKTEIAESARCEGIEKTREKLFEVPEVREIKENTQAEDWILDTMEPVEPRKKKEVHLVIDRETYISNYAARALKLNRNIEINRVQWNFYEDLQSMTKEILKITPATLNSNLNVYLLQVFEGPPSFLEALSVEYLMKTPGFRHSIPQNRRCDSVNKLYKRHLKIEEVPHQPFSFISRKRPLLEPHREAKKDASQLLFHQDEIQEMGGVGMHSIVPRKDVLAEVSIERPARVPMEELDLLLEGITNKENLISPPTLKLPHSALDLEKTFDGSTNKDLIGVPTSMMEGSTMDLTVAATANRENLIGVHPSNVQQDLTFDGNVIAENVVEMSAQKIQLPTVDVTLEGIAKESLIGLPMARILHSTPERPETERLTASQPMPSQRVQQLQGTTLDKNKHSSWFVPTKKTPPDSKWREFKYVLSKIQEFWTLSDMQGLAKTVTVRELLICEEGEGKVSNFFTLVRVLDKLSFQRKLLLKCTATDIFVEPFEIPCVSPTQYKLRDKQPVF